jgi:hypothetical protein
MITTNLYNYTREGASLIIRRYSDLNANKNWNTIVKWFYESNLSYALSSDEIILYDDTARLAYILAWG